MRELCDNYSGGNIMFIPEYTITNKILQNIASIEYVKALADHSVILTSLENRQKKVAEVDFIRANLNLEGIKIGNEELNKYVDGIVPLPAGIIQGIKKSLDSIQNDTLSGEINEGDILEIFAQLSGYEEFQKQNISMYREKIFQKQTENLKNEKVHPEEILSQMTELIDWTNSLDAKETHPLIKVAIIKGRIIELEPFRLYNEIMGNLVSHKVLNHCKYNLKGLSHLEMAYTTDLWGYKKALETISIEKDMTSWIDFYTEAMATKAGRKKEDILLLAKDTKISQASGDANLTERQNRIVEYLQDYGKIQNQDFSKIFPDISEDSVLRDLKVLIEEGVVVKRGKTKSSRYELR